MIRIDENAFFNTNEFAQTAVFRSKEIDTPDIIIDFDPEPALSSSLYGELGMVQVGHSQGITPQYQDLFVIDGKEWIVFQDVRKNIRIIDDGISFQCPVGCGQVFNSWR